MNECQREQNEENHARKDKRGRILRVGKNRRKWNLELGGYVKGRERDVRVYPRKRNGGTKQRRRGTRERNSTN